jgi:hypothetical protein
MKLKLLLTVVLLGILRFANAQSCDSLTVTEEDKFNGFVTHSNKSPIDLYNKNRAHLSIIIMHTSNGNTILFSCQVTNGSIKCVDDNSQIYFVSDNGFKISAFNNAHFNCQQQNILYLAKRWGNENVLAFLLANKLSAIRVEGVGSNEDFDVDSKTADYIKGVLNCVYER